MTLSIRQKTPQKVKVVGLIFDVVSKIVVAFDASLLESVALTYLFSRNLNDYFKNRLFSLPFCPREEKVFQLS